MNAFLSTATFAALVLVATPSLAVTRERVFASNPAGLCQSALPVFDGVIRKRPKAVTNEGTSDAFITCSFTSQGGDGTTDARNPRAIVVYLRSLSGAPQTISCTAVPGWDGFTIAPSVTKTMSAGAGSLTWLASDFGEDFYLPASLISISCKLPPSSAINDMYIYFDEDVSA